ncbi:hypothetical protein SKAU_G00273620 [Synaphobranchus kaupii]|uniref:Uncharacterized protein n=1 Tax=Synaphobranchus kaupii TaxID=118154 RepID=A0A9Q1F0V7_SYNKA|nr:hypothetical protein SKAU_G00273620 [Synaphobranchus kaupii]
MANKEPSPYHKIANLLPSDVQLSLYLVPVWVVLAKPADSTYFLQKEILEAFLCLREKDQVPAYITSEDIKDWMMADGRKILWERESTASSKSAVRRSTRSYFDGCSVVRRALKDITEVLARPQARPAHTVSEVVGETVTSLLCAVMGTANKTASSRAFSDVAVGVVVSVLEDLRAAGRGEEQVLGVRCWRWARASLVGALHRDLLEQTGSPGGLQAALRGNNATVTTAITAAIKTLLTSAADATPNASPTMPEQEQKDQMTPPEREDLTTAPQQEELNTVLEIEDLNTALEIEELNTALEIEELNTALEVKDLNTALEIEELNTALEIEELNTALEVKDLNTALEIEELNTALEIDELNTVHEREELNTVLEVKDLNTALEIEELNIALEIEELNIALEIEELNIALEIEELNTALEIDELNTVHEREELNTTHEREEPNTSPEEEDGQLSDMKPLEEERGVQDGFEVENTAPLGRAAGEPLDLPQKKKQKKGVRRFFGRLWKVLKHTCCCCCSVSVETD